VHAIDREEGVLAVEIVEIAVAVVPGPVSLVEPRLHRRLVRRIVRSLEGSVDLETAPTAKVPFTSEATIGSAGVGRSQRSQVSVSASVPALGSPAALEPSVSVADPDERAVGGESCAIVRTVGCTAAAGAGGGFRTASTRARGDVAENDERCACPRWSRTRVSAPIVVMTVP